MGPLDGIRVVEIASEWGAYAGKLIADLGAEVTVVEPPGGHHTRTYGPFAGDEPDPESSLWWWQYNTQKLGVTLELETPAGRDALARLVHGADVLLVGDTTAALVRLGIDPEALRQAQPDLIVVSVTPFGREGPRSDEQATDLTLMATGGPVWSCGYDDHTLPPVRGGGNQAMHTGGHFAAIGLLVAVIEREAGGTGQFVDVNINAALNVTTEMASYGWLVGGVTMQRQTGRHASPVPTQSTQVQCADGRWLNTGVGPRQPRDFAAIGAWLDELGLTDSALPALLELGSGYDHISTAQIFEDPLIGEIFGAAREAVALIASKLPAYEAFVGFQQRGVPVGIVYSPEEVMEDPHFVERGFPVVLDGDQLGRPVTYPGAPYRFERTPWALRRRAPKIGEHNDRLDDAGAASPGPEET